MKIKELLTDASKWTQGTFARDKKGNIVSVNDNSAVSWCLGGAMHKCYPDDVDYYKIKNLVSNCIVTSIPDWNDDLNRTFANVRDLVQKLDI